MNKSYTGIVFKNQNLIKMTKHNKIFKTSTKFKLKTKNIKNNHTNCCNSML